MALGAFDKVEVELVLQQMLLAIQRLRDANLPIEVTKSEEIIPALNLLIDRAARLKRYVLPEMKFEGWGLKEALTVLADLRDRVQAIEGQIPVRATMKPVFELLPDEGYHFAKAYENWDHGLAKRAATTFSAGEAGTVNAHPCMNHQGDNEDAATNIAITIPAVAMKTPNVVDDEVIRYIIVHDADDGSLIRLCVSQNAYDMPIGTIIWTPTAGEGEFSRGWYRCNGANDDHGNPVPDLDDRFIRHTNTAAGADEGLSTGGSADHTHDDHPVHTHSLDTTSGYIYAAGAVAHTGTNFVNNAAVMTHSTEDNDPKFIRLGAFVRTDNSKVA